MNHPIIKVLSSVKNSSQKRKKIPTISIHVRNPHLADLMPHLVVRHDTQPGETLVISRELELPREVLVEEVVLEAVEAEELRAVSHRPP